MRAHTSTLQPEGTVSLWGTLKGAPPLPGGTLSVVAARPVESACEDEAGGRGPVAFATVALCSCPPLSALPVPDPDAHAASSRPASATGAVKRARVSAGVRRCVGVSQPIKRPRV